MEHVRNVSSFHRMPTSRSITTESVTMAPFDSPLRRLIIAGGFALAVAAAPAIGAVAVPVQGFSPLACSAGEEEDLFTNACVPHTVPNSPAVPQNTVAGTDNIPTVDGVPCEGARGDAQCRGLAEENPAPGPAPQSSVDGQNVG
jgi:hypothetical protein